MTISLGGGDVSFALREGAHICQIRNVYENIFSEKIYSKFLSTQKCVKCDKMDVSSKHRKDSIRYTFVMWSNDKLLPITNVEQFVIDSHDKIAPHDK